MSVEHDITLNNLLAAGYRPLHAGDDYDYDFTLKRNGVALDLTSATIWLTVKDDPVAEDSGSKLQLTTPTEILITDAPNGQFTVKFASADTASLEGEWDYDIQVKLGSGEVITYARGLIEFLPNITRSTS